jgi:hypothetical protein
MKKQTQEELGLAGSCPRSWQSWPHCSHSIRQDPACWDLPDWYLHNAPRLALFSTTKNILNERQQQIFILDDDEEIIGVYGASAKDDDAIYNLGFIVWKPWTI